MDNISAMPLPFFLSVIALIALGFHGWSNRHSGWGLPMGMVLITIAFWYHGDALYNDYEEYRLRMGDRALEAAWWQVLWFLVVFGLLARPCHQLLNRGLGRGTSRIMVYYETRLLEAPRIQRRLDRFASMMLVAWLILMALGLWRVQFNFIGLFAPYLGERVNPWSRGRMGGGLDAVFSLAGYAQILLTAGFGVILAVARNPRTWSLALLVCALAIPFYFIDRTRNTMIAVLLPGLLAWVFFRLRVSLPGKIAVLAVAYLALNFWFSFVIANRGGSIAQQLGDEAAIARARESRHEGISMFSELGYMNDFFQQGVLEVNYGQRYFAELVNPIPRAIWANKPTAGLEYAVARGFGDLDADDEGGGVTASIASGMIGQGLLNFGRFFGPMAAALIMATWVAILARQDRLGQDPARLLLYAIGMILTFNMGRDITLLVLYPFLFGWLGLHIAIRAGWYLPPSPVEMHPRKRKRRRPGSHSTKNSTANMSAGPSSGIRRSEEGSQ